MVKARAASMKAAAAAGDHGMLSVVGLADDALRTCVEDAKRHLVETDDGSDVDNLVCEVATTFSAHARVRRSRRARGGDQARRRRRRVEVRARRRLRAFHTSRMASARDALVEALANVTVSAPKIPAYSSVMGSIVSNASEIPKLLAEQLVSPVLWEQTVVNLLAEGKDAMYELGPNSQIKSMVKRQPDLGAGRNSRTSTSPSDARSIRGRDDLRRRRRRRARRFTPRDPRIVHPASRNLRS